MIFFTIFYQMVPFFQVWSIKQILTLFLFSASVYYRDKWINNAAIIVCVCVCVCVYVCARFCDKSGHRFV